jgi:hypothetical protein
LAKKRALRMRRAWRGRGALEELFRSGEVVNAAGGLTLSERQVVADETGRAVEEFMGYAPTAFEELGGATRVRKDFRAAAPLKKAVICVAGCPVRGKGRIEGTFNGKRFSVPGKVNCRGWYSEWLLIPAPAAVRRGRNTLVMCASGDLAWRLFIEPSKSPDRSARSLDGGRTWDLGHLGLGGFIDGEYVIRLSGRRTAGEGTVTSPPVQVRAGRGVAGIAGRVTGLSVKTSSKLPVEVRIGNGPWADRPGAWSGWRRPGAGAVRAMERELGEAGPRFVQWRAKLEMRGGRAPVLKSAELSVEMAPSVGAGGLRVDVRGPATVLPGRPFAHQRPNRRLAAVRRHYGLDRVWARGGNDWESMLLLSGWVGNYCSYRKPGPFMRGTRYDLVEILEFGHSKTCKVLCGQLAFAFVQLACAYGQTARVICRGNHLVTEVWSPVHRKWAVVDTMDQVWNAKQKKWVWTPGFGGYYHAGDGVPLSAIALGRIRGRVTRRHLVWKTRKYASRRATVERDLKWFRREVSWPERNNHTDCWEPVFYGDVFRYSGHLKYRRGTERVMPWYTTFTSRRGDLEWTVGECAVHLTALGSDRVLVQVDSRMSSMAGLQISGRGAAEDALWPSDSYLWIPSRAGRKLSIIAENSFGVRGPATVCRVRGG